MAKHGWLYLVGPVVQHRRGTDGSEQCRRLNSQRQRLEHFLRAQFVQSLALRGGYQQQAYRLRALHHFQQFRRRRVGRLWFLLRDIGVLLELLSLGQHQLPASDAGLERRDHRVEIPRRAGTYIVGFANPHLLQLAVFGLGFNVVRYRSDSRL